MLKFDNITLCLIDCINYEQSKIAIEKTLNICSFKDIKIFSDKCFYSNIVLIPKITSKEAYSYFIFKNLYKYIKTDFVLIIQHDGYVLNENWNNEFLDYDYIGAAWWYSERNVGNGGFSLRSKRLLKEISKKEYTKYHPEDDIICRFYRYKLESKGFKFAPEELANKFSFEKNGKYRTYNNQFGFHGENLN